MRIAVTYSYRGKIGGIESYLDAVIKEFVRDGHEVSYWYEVKNDSTSEPIELTEGVQASCVEELGVRRTVDSLRAWTPDIIYSHGLLNTSLEDAILTVAPAVIFVHGYYGTCISGSKAFSRPNPAPCDRRFGSKCLLNYHVRGCGGLNPVTMIKEYNRQSHRLRSLQKYAAIVTASSHMKREFIRNGVSSQKVHQVSLPLGSRRERAAVETSNNGAANGHTVKRLAALVNGCDNESESDFAGIWRLLFLGRMTHLKGGEMLLDALPTARKMLDRPLQVTFAGDGPDRKNWQRKAERIQRHHAGLDITFPGWISGFDLQTTLRNSDLLVMPSVWPEPFGLVGPEAGMFGVPAAAFNVGGIRDWLTDGVNGFLAPGNPPTWEGLAEAIVKCLADPNMYARLRAGAFEAAQRFSVESHLVALLEVFSHVTGRDFRSEAAQLTSGASATA